MRGKKIKTGGRKLLLDALELIDISGEFQTTEVYSNLDLTKAKCSIYKHSREENLYVTERIRPKIFIQSENT
jgi:hypothetical protein